MKFLTDEERCQLKAQHKKERDKRICDRIKAVLLYDKGWTPAAIAEALLLSDDAIRDHIDEYKDSKKLKPISGGSEEKFSAQKAAELESHLKTHTYLFVKDIIAHVKITYDIEYSIAGMRNWLHKHGFSYKKPSIVPGKANQQLQKNWIAEYEKLKQNLLDDETICFMDGVHPTHNVQTACGWIKKGERKELLGNTGRSRVNLSGVIDVLAHKVIVQEDKTLNADSIISFLKKIEEAYPQKTKIYLFCDNAPYYRNKSVLEHLETSKITLKFLPPYSPNLNPIERLWKWMKERIIYNTYYEYFEDFKAAIFGFFSVLSTLDPESILGKYFRSRVRDKFSPLGV